MVYRDAVASDIEQVAAIEMASMSMPWSADNFMEALTSEHTVFMVADDGGRIAGFVILYLSVPEAELPDIVVDASYRGQGVGNQLLAHAIDAVSAMGVSDIFLEVRTSNSPARHLYAKHNFLQIGVRKNFYNNPTEDAICMQLKG